MNQTEEIELLKKEVEAIKVRNHRVEADKAWELSRTRTLFIAASTYVLVFIFLLLIKDDFPFLNAFAASASYIISTESYGVLKKWWLGKRNN